MSFKTPKVTHIDDNHFRIENVDVSVANGLRRIILSEIPVYGFRGFPHKECKIDILKNTTRFNNEVLKQRIMCIPVNLKPSKEEGLSYEFEIHKKNDRDDNVTEYVTTADFKITDTRTGKELTRSEVQTIFPKNPITKDYILLARLRPKMSDDFLGEELHFKATLEVVNAKMDGTYNVVSTCAYSNTMDKNPERLEKMWNEKKESLTGLSEDELKKERQNWNIHDVQRIFVPNSYDFTIDSIGIYSNKAIMRKACDIMIEKLEKFNATELEYKRMNTHIVRAKLMNEDYTLGKVMEYGIYHLFYETSTRIVLVNFRKLHPHNTYGILRIDFPLDDKDENDIKKEYSELTDTARQTLIPIFEKIKSNFK
jgi:hypothetical protein